jgi:hypothetical protein
LLPVCTALLSCIKIRSKKGASIPSETIEKTTERIHKEYGFKRFDENIKPFYTLVDSGMYKGKWDYTKAKGMDKL